MVVVGVVVLRVAGLVVCAVRDRRSYRSRSDRVHWLKVILLQVATPYTPYAAISRLVLRNIFLLWARDYTTEVTAGPVTEEFRFSDTRLWSIGRAMAVGYRCFEVFRFRRSPVDCGKGVGLGRVNWDYLIEAAYLEHFVDRLCE